MTQENYYGSHSGFRHDEHHGSEPELSVSSHPQNLHSENSELVDLSARFAPSQREIDLYYFYYSSRL